MYIKQFRNLLLNSNRLSNARITAGPELEMLAAWLATNPALTELE